MNKKKKDINFKRNYIFLGIVVILLGIVSYFSLNIYKYQKGQLNPQIDSITGYQVDGSNYTVSEEEHNMVLSGLPEDSRELILYFNQAVETDTVEHVILCRAGEAVRQIDTSIVAGQAFNAVKYADKDIDSIVLSIDGNFDLAGIVSQCTLEADGDQKTKLSVEMIICVIILLIIAGGAAWTSQVDSLISTLFFVPGKVCDTLKSRDFWKEAGVCVLAVAAGNILWIFARGRLMEPAWKGTMPNYLFGSMAGILMFMLVRYLIVKKTSFERLYLGCGLLMGAVLAILLPLHLNVSWDDQIHFNYAVCFSHGNRNVQSIAENDYYNSCFQQYMKELGNSDRKTLSAVLDDKKADHGYVEGEIGVLQLYKVIVYLPVAVTLLLARGLGIPVSIYIILGRMASILFYVYAVYRGMRHLKSGKVVMATASMVPIALFVSANYNYDYWLIALISYSFARLIGEYQRPEEVITWKSLAVIVGSFGIASVVKPVYVPLLGLLMFLPKSKFKTKKNWYLYIGFFVVLILGMAAVIGKLVFGGGLGSGDVRGGEAVDAAAQIQYIINHPKTFMQTLMTFMKTYISPASIKLDLVDTAYIPRKEWLGSWVFVWLILAAFFDRDRDINRRISWMPKAAMVLLAFVCACAAAAAMYIVFTPVGEGNIYGCQGRYLLPILFPLMGVLSSIRFLVIPLKDGKKRWMETVAMTGSVIMAGIMMTSFV